MCFNFTDLMLPLDGNTYPSLQAARDAAAPVLAYGNFIHGVLSDACPSTVSVRSSDAQCGHFTMACRMKHAGLGIRHMRYNRGQFQ